MTAVVETSMQQPPVLTSSWAASISEWEQRSPGDWVCELKGEHHGAAVTQQVMWLWIPSVNKANVYYSCLYVDRRGPSCPSWCSEHANQIPDRPDLESEYIYHAHRTSVGDAVVDLTAVEDARTGELAEVSITLPDACDPVDASTARQVAEALMQAADLLDGGQR